MVSDGEKTFRFGVNMVLPGSRDEWGAKCRRVEELGYDVLSVADHLAIAPPFPALVLAGAVTERVRLNTFVLNAPFYNPVLLARDVAGTDQFVSGRLELGLGAGYVKAEFEAAGMPFPSAGARVDHLELTIKELGRLYADPEYAPKPVQSGGPPLMIGGRGDRLLSLAAEHAATIAFSGMAKVRDGAPPMLATAESVEERTRFVAERLAGRAAEFNVLVQFVQITDDRESALREILARLGGTLTLDELAEVPTVLVGTVEEIAEQLVAHRARFGFSYFTILEPNLEVLAPVVKLLCRR
ncbi:TIGR03621 family F420-dependent LLM class oxidoreductase [Amycolatopsis rubida]|uniref:Probable F420-dependent oxidoreductase, MSMEG_2516 family n=1 Tax=Amycolatopsis rubida TaxID=112413 RepID=A0A1I5FBN7_9PSEU|nr:MULTISPECIES: TIGR03621 family F420-dependent LLM class oxidoreductase [Amycolatopsis]MYW91832.1 TIGR03621 family F420-dependent LLM class oxidoreductase [Amycolatopsis rubida]NEC56817.1 TIGR03621 family F420-dependent LLM class oxidoreductase [Amycolatopsis rubida]OAP28016.1 F420-dependent glucose-6-phosphate dehydrogenase [Amycolatopsis sp. M39]SFO21167.1 probable F420-dependent oxidoreductase, MSMEG_2516 family [Amycolatopsis rubida]